MPSRPRPASAKPRPIRPGDWRYGRRRPGPPAGEVATVEEPVPEAAQDLGREGGGRHGVQRSRSRRGRRRRSGLGRPAPPATRATRPPTAGRCAHAARSARIADDLVRHHGGVHEPQQRRDGDQDQGRGVDPADRGHHEREQGRVPPTATTSREDGRGRPASRARPTETAGPTSARCTGGCTAKACRGRRPHTHPGGPGRGGVRTTTPRCRPRAAAWRSTAAEPPNPGRPGARAPSTRARAATGSRWSGA